MVQDTDRENSVDRRTYLAAIASAGAASIAGCAMNGDGSDGDHGERVAELLYMFTTGLGNWSSVEQSVANTASKNMSERLGLKVSPTAKESTTLWQEQIHDERTAHLYASGFAPNPSGLDPNFFMELYHIRYAGNRDGFNKPHYHSCEFSSLAEEQYFSANEDERADLIQQAMETFSNDIPEITTFPLVGYSAINTNQVVDDDELLGEMGPGGYNYNFMINMEAKTDQTPSLDVATAALNTTVHPQLTTIAYHGYWANLVYSPLMKWDQNYNLVTELAENYEVTNEFKEVTMTLKDHAFTNGEPVTAEDVVYTYDLYNTDYDGFGASNEMQGTVEAVDERTVRFSFDVSNPTFLRGGGLTAYGILPKAHWQERMGEPENLPNMDLPLDEIVGSGPYIPTNFEPNTILQLTPNEDHYNTPNQDLNLRAFTSTQAAYRAFQEENLSIFLNANGTMAEEIEQQDNRSVDQVEAYTIGSIAPQMSYPPFQFREFRLAASQAIDRREANAVAVRGNSTPMLHSNFVAPSHPFYPDDHEGLTKIAPSPTGNEEVARETLSDAGYTWDSDGRLRYPEDKDLTPKWPQGESPMDHPDEWPCVENIPEGY